MRKKINKIISLKIISLKIYPYDIMFSINETDKEFKKTLKLCGALQACENDEIIEFNQNTLNGRVIGLSTGNIIIRIKAYPKIPDEWAVLQHEIFHAVYFIMKRMGMELCDASDEAYAYLLGYITKRIYKEIFKLNK